MSNLQGQGFVLSIPDDWEGGYDEVFTLSKPDGVGCLQVSESVQNVPVLPEDLYELVKDHVEAGAKVKTVQLGSFRGITLAYGDEEAFWQHWYVSHSNLLLFITYNCAPEDRGTELDEAKYLLNSLAVA